MKQTATIWVLAGIMVLLFGFAGQAGAFCVHNYTDRDVHFKQLTNCGYMQGYESTLSPNTSGCCNWGTSDCNKSGGKTDTVTFRVGYIHNIYDIEICKGIPIPACSDLDVTGSNGHYRCVPHGKETCN